MIRTIRSDPPLTASIVLFFVGVSVGLLTQSPIIPVDSPTGGEQSIWFFFSRNTMVATLLYVGTFTFGVSTSITLFYNGFVVGYALSGSENVLYSIVLLVPHAIVELPAFWLAGAAGLRVPFELIRYFSGNQETLLRKSSVKRSGRQFAFAILLLGVAAWIEAIVTPMVATAF